jgi:hypothetical protein
LKFNEALKRTWPQKKPRGESPSHGIFADENDEAGDEGNTTSMSQRGKVLQPHPSFKNEEWYAYMIN